MIQASIDLGTNTCLLLVKDGDRILHDESTVVRLGQGVDQSGLLTPEAMDRAYQCISTYAKVAEKLGAKPNTIIAVGTAQARDAKNAAEFFSKIEKETGIRFRVLSGDEEARATFNGAALPNMNTKHMVVIDIGGGSTELVSEVGGKSLNIGAVRMTERFLKSDPVTDREFWDCENAIDHTLQEMKAWRKSLSFTPQFVAVAGTAVTLGMIQAGMKEYDRAAIDGITFNRADAHWWVQNLKLFTIEQRKKLIGMEVKRADVILGGAMILWRVMEELNFPEVTVSTRGLRYGVLK